MSARSGRISADDGHPVAITQALENRVQELEQQFRDLDSELRHRFGDQSYSVERSEQALAAIERLRWAISRSPIVNPLATPSGDGEYASDDM